MVSQVKKSELLYTHLQVGVGADIDIETPASSTYPQHRWKQGKRWERVSTASLEAGEEVGIGIDADIEIETPASSAYPQHLRNQGKRWEVPQGSWNVAAGRLVDEKQRCFPVQKAYRVMRPAFPTARYTRASRQDNSRNEADGNLQGLGLGVEEERGRFPFREYQCSCSATYKQRVALTLCAGKSRVDSKEGMGLTDADELGNGTLCVLCTVVKVACMSMRNVKELGETMREMGANQHGTKEYPPDAVLVAAFQGYARENSGSGLGYNDQLARLKEEFGLDIKRNSLATLRKRLNIDSVRTSKGKKTDVEMRQGVIDLKQNDVAGGWGVDQVRGRLANTDARLLIPRDSLRQILHNEFGDEFDNRFVGKKKALKHRVPLWAMGPWHQEHFDGHEKLSEQGLDIGAGIHLPIYGSKDQFCSFAHALLLMPNVRKGNAIAHFYLDLVKARGCSPILIAENTLVKISMQMTTDMGSEVNEMHKIHETLRDEVAPELVPPAFPHGVKQLSTKNTPIESFWRWVRDGDGHSTKLALQSGAATGIFLPHDDIHRHTFYWLWVPLIQQGLDNFREYWNNHRLQKSKGKLNASGSSPLNMLINPTSVVATARNCSINVNPQTVYRLREAYGGQAAREEAFRFISREFQADADAVYVDLGCPVINLATAWGIFQQVVAELEVRYASQ
ncbi:hypothetical protein DFH08DRAFT_799823 [Mycena albidolilacea]|uniref:Uncharacterized protein n=1 Tax=Mycena albidolilacea TaxID=1033008 RepID=A0AAD7F2E8_9AGAR|nr:hypothetical protein DFH08DRAFT_799823 [Mycena albidolilacea]